MGWKKKCLVPIADWEFLLGFEPAIQGAPMEPISCLLLKSICQTLEVKKVLDLGTGSGNSAASAVSGGATEVLSIDSEAGWSRSAKKKFRGWPIQFEVRPMVPYEETKCYDLANVDKNWDLVISDGPGAGDGGSDSRLAPLDFVNTLYLIIHDAFRHRKDITERFGDDWSLYSADLEVSFLNRGLALISV
jgi:hypothetical protein